MRRTLLLVAAALLASVALANDNAPADPRLVLQTSVERLTELLPELRAVDVAGFAGRGGHSLCADALTDALLAALDEEARNPNRMLREKPLTVRRARAASPPPEGAATTASGTFEVDQRGRAHLSLAYRQGDALLAPTGRVAVAIDKLGCDPTPRPFLDHVAASARLDREKLDVTAPVFAVGQRLEIAIAVRAPMRLHCWVLAEDGTAYVTLPAGGEAPLARPGVLRYPRDFRLDDVALTGRFENLFACFGAEEPLSEALADAWGRYGREAALVDAQTVQALMAEMRAQPGVSEATARVVVR
jgi:hypothetical protein